MVYLLHHLLTESASVRPEKESVRFEGASLTYAELDALSNQLAWALRASGMRRGDRVGIYVHKSLASVFSVFGVLKAGGVYVPLDPNAPPKRLTYITRNCDIRVLVTSRQKLPSLLSFFAEGTPLQAVVLTDEDDANPVGLPESVRVMNWAEVRTHDAGPVPADGTIETDLAYVLYTSGSTGDPKGVMIAHRTSLTFINWCYETFEMTATDRVTSHAPLHFDLSIFDIFVTIKAGGTVAIVPETLSVFPVKLADLLQNERITVTYLVPSVLTSMVRYGRLERHDFSTLRTILFAGEVFPIKYLRQLMNLIPHTDYYNLYGPTETNVCTYYKVPPLDPERTAPIPIGISCENTECFAVDDNGQVVTRPGVEGALYVRGSTVAQGYWGDPEKTARSFLENRWNPNYREVVYRTGDIVTLGQDGVNWLYLGRRDHMVKSRGYRIELGDIEAALYSHEAVVEAAAVAIPDEMIGHRIKAFVVVADGARLTKNELVHHCAQHLPRYMIPEMFEFRDRLPKTSTGKTDRQRLAAAG